MLTRVFLISVLGISPLVMGQDTTSTGFFYPRSSNLGPYAGFLDASCGSDNNYISGLFHLGKDSWANLNESVYAIADGEVVYVSPRGWIYGDLTGTQAGDGITSNVGLLIKHKTASGFWFQAVYGHILTGLRAGDQVRAGVPIGKIGPYGDQPHVHFGIRIPLNNVASDIPASNYGRGSCSDWPLGPQDRWIDPIQFIQTQRPNNYLGSSGGGISPQIYDVNPKTVLVGTNNTFTLSGTGFQSGFSAKLWVGNNSYAVDPSQTNFMNLTQAQITVRVGVPTDSTTAFCLQITNAGGPASNQFCGLTAQAAGVGASGPNLQISFSPNPVPRSSDGSWYYTVIVTETNGVTISLNTLLFAGNDYSQKLTSWFGTNQIPAHGQISNGFSTSGSAGNWPWTFGGNGLTWSQNVTLQP